MSNKVTENNVPEEDYWEDGSVGVEEAAVEVVSDEAAAGVDDAMELQMISIRLNKSLLADLKQLAELYETGYQPLVREALSRFVVGEKKRILRGYLAEKQRAEEAEGDQSVETSGTERKRA